MTSNNIIIIVVIVVVGIVGLWLHGRSKTKKMAFNMMYAIYIIWAAQGPFKTRKEHGAAWFLACKSVHGTRLYEEFPPSIPYAMSSASLELLEMLRRAVLTAGDPTTIAFGKEIASADEAERKAIADSKRYLDTVMKHAKSRRSKEEKIIYDKVTNYFVMDWPSDLRDFERFLTELRSDDSEP